ncbi:uncharacterized protein LOC100182535 [Ciona intestinalis]
MSVFDLALIAEVESHPNIYNRKLQCYRDRRQRDTAWQEVATKLNTTVNDCQRRWKALRDKYGRIRKKEQIDFNNGEYFPSEWDLAEKLSFLEEFRVTRGICTTVNDDTTMDILTDNDIPPSLHPSFANMNNFNNHPKLEAALAITEVTGHDDSESVGAKFLAKKLKDTRDMNDADELFFASVLCEISGLPPKKKGKLKIDIMNLVHKALYDVTD